MALTQRGIVTLDYHSVISECGGGGIVSKASLNSHKMIMS